MLSGMSVKREVNSGSAVVTLTNDSNTAFNFGADALAYHIAGADGKMYEKDNAVANQQINSGTDWIIPNASAPGTYRIRHTSVSGDTADFTPAGTINVYLALTAARNYLVTDTTTGTANKSCTYTLQIDDGTTSQDTGSFTLIADREDA